MKDTDLRGIMLQQFYDRRKQGYLGWGVKNVQELTYPQKDGVTPEDMLRICDQLGEHNLIEWKPLRQQMGETVGGVGRINAFGVDVVEGGVQSPIAIHFTDKSISVAGSTGVQIAGDNANQQQTVTHHVEHIIRMIDSAPIPETDKKEAKFKLGEFLKTKAADALYGIGNAALLKMLGL